MMQGSEKDREEFEAWFVLRARQKNTSVLSGYTDGEIRDAFLSTTPEESGAYVCASIRMAWEAWQAARRAQPAQVPEGWKLVPAIPTLEMQQAALKYVARQYQTRDVYRAMIAAAPKPPDGLMRENPATKQGEE